MPSIELGRRALTEDQFGGLSSDLQSQIQGSEGYNFLPILGAHVLEGDALNLFLGSQIDQATDPAQISPTGGTPQLPRVPRQGGSLLGTAASRALSRSAFSRTRQQGIRRPLVSGY
jgi:hypothetical protein